MSSSDGAAGTANGGPRNDAASGGGAGENAGTPGDLLSGFEATATHWTHEVGDPDVSKALLLGWRVGIALDWAAKGSYDEWPDDDPGLGSDSRWSVLKGQIESAAQELTGGVGASFALPALSVAPPQPTQADAVSSYCTALTRRLYVTGQFRGLAFFVGCNLERACAGTRGLLPANERRQAPTSGTGGSSQHDSEQAGTAPSGAADLAADIPALKKAILGLATKLPPNAAHSVINSLTLWEEQLKPEKALTFNGTLVRKQGGVWRSILSGDVAAKDLLRLADYIGTGEQVAAQLKYLARRTLRGHLLVPVIGVAVVGLVGFALLFFNRTAAAGAGALLAAGGLSWKAVGQYLGKAVAGVEQSVWDGQLDWTIAYRTTMSLAAPPAPAPHKKWKHVPGAQLRPADHYATWLRWKEQWPTFELEA